MRISVDDYNIYGDEPSGVNKKVWIKKGEKLYLFKPQKDEKNEKNQKQTNNTNKELVYGDVAECISSDIAKLLGIDCAEYILCTRNNEKGVISPNFLKNKPYDVNEEELIHGKVLISAIDKGFNNKGSTGKIYKIYTISLILDVLEKYNLIKPALEMIVFDCLIANTDRNPSNWGIIKNVKNNSIRFAPLYDNSSSLFLSGEETKEFNKYFSAKNQKFEYKDKESEEHMVHNFLESKISLERHFQKELAKKYYKKQDFYDYKHERRKYKLLNIKEFLKSDIDINAALFKLRESEKIEKPFFSNMRKKQSEINGGKKFKKYEFITIIYKEIIDYLTSFYPNEIEEIIHKIENQINEENVNNILKKYSDETSFYRLEIAKSILLERSKFITSHYYSNKNRNLGR